MPELPEVETIVRDLQKKIAGQTVVHVTIHDPRVVRHSPPAQFTKGIIGQKIERVSRRGKAIVMVLQPSGDQFVVQLMMTGQLIFSSSPAPARDTKVTFQLLKKGWVHYNDFRTFGRLQIVRDLKEIPYFEKLGPEPLEQNFTVHILSDRLKNRKTPIKPLLLNHQFVAGIGNIYASEILYASQIHPARAARSLDPEEVVRLHTSIKDILKTAVRLRGSSMNTYRDTDGQKGRFMTMIRVYGREQDACEHCQTTIIREFQSGRSTFYCPSCQK